jgi:hypothetical protein
MRWTAPQHHAATKKDEEVAPASDSLPDRPGVAKLPNASSVALYAGWGMTPMRVWRLRSVVPIAMFHEVWYLSRSVKTLWEGTPVDTILAEQIQDVIKALAVAESQAATVRATMREQRIFLGLDYDFIEDDIARLKDKVRYMQLLARHRRDVMSNWARSQSRQFVMPVGELGQPACRSWLKCPAASYAGSKPGAGAPELRGYDMDTWEYGIADLDPRNDQILSTQGPLPQVDSDEMINDLMNYLLRVGSIGWELMAVAPVEDGMRLFFKKRHMEEA